ncbi:MULTISPECIES: DUF5694 domain-containing protein [Stenotrophomonas]|uniref:DUF5694 domain-containing protein n=1 Tax=Stenotrophomonas TaxID=40323 RepID=UPI0013133ADD|nr:MULTISPECIES: DUF5694 domain-containing protein [Stenotrophomonas]MCU1000574.1 hypothetical protein [Stenotrophomonas maltophilia]MCU1067476.1 hypothetical protein [Stenotrophomonas maltophilia]MCU1075885.1 hypothetical protein [Stenotrophomonas maltophilia]MCU1139615.1 hypothetical protein [Stenotrophomonas maltophilia]
MFPRIATLLFLAMCSNSALATDTAYRPAFHPDRLKGPPAGRPNEVLVLGTTHLSGLPTSFQPASLEPLLQRLVAWKPELIATEDLSGLQCDFMRRYPARYAESVATYCFDTTAAQVATGLDVPAANTQAERLLATWPNNPTPAQRRRLAALFLAAGERGSAQVQWLRLPASERKDGDGLTPALVEILDKGLVRRNETHLIAAEVAARLGHERLWAVDDHTADSPTPAEDEAAASAAITGAWNNAHTQARKDADKRLLADLDKPGGVMALYRAYNSPTVAMTAYQSDFGATLVEPSPKAFGRMYVGYWETRNLRMVANIRDVLGLHPGRRMLAIVGVSHKGYYEAYLNQMHDVRLVNSDNVLR